MQSQKAGSQNRVLHRAKVISWLLYDFGMSWFSMVVLTAYFILYFREVIVGDKGYADFLWGATMSSAMVVSVVLSPLLGATVDVSGRKKSFLAAFAGISILSLFLLYFTGPGQTAAAIFLVGAGYVGYTTAMTFYNALLPETAGPGSMEKLSGIGWGLGYIGGLVALICMALTVSSVAGGRHMLLVAGSAYALFALPCLIVFKDSPKGGAGAAAAMGEAFSRLAKTFREIRIHRRIFIFLIAYFFLSDAISTVIVFFSSYTVFTLHFTVKQNFTLLMLIQASAAVGAAASGAAANRIGTIPTIIITVLIWISALLGIIIFSGIGPFYALSICAGLVLGGTQATARSYMAIEAPEGKKTEFFGFMTFSAKVGAIFGPLIYGTISSKTGSPRMAVLSLEALFVLGLLFMFMVPRTKPRRIPAPGPGETS